MGGVNKAGLNLAGQTLLERAIARLQPQCGGLLVSANDPDLASTTAFPVVRDADDTYTGPLAGILAAMDWALINVPDAQWLITAPVDCPFLPDDFAGRLWQSMTQAKSPLALAVSGGQVHFVCGLWRLDLAAAIRSMLVDQGERRAQTIVEQCGYATALWEVEPFDPFFNVNTRENLAAAAAIASRD